jgi:SAM-dependent methyltransferase
MRSAVRDFIEQHIDLFCCPSCGADFAVCPTDLVCSGCQQPFHFEGNIPRLFWPTESNGGRLDVTDAMKSFYEENPFPNYDDFDDVGTLVEKARQGIFAKLLDDEVPFGTKIIEIGCGTGQLTNFLSVANRTAIGADLSLSSLRLGEAFREKHDLYSAFFLQMNLFRPCFKPNAFDLVISNGVLHHTADPLSAFKTIAKLVKPRGYILIGLYHKYGRIATDIRRFIFRVTKDHLKFLDGRLVNTRLSCAKRHAWFMDQYKNPHESKHTISEVLDWLDEAGLQFVKSIPKTVPFAPLSDSEELFEPDVVGNWLERRIVETSMMFTGSSEGGFFIVIAQKPA